MKTSKLSKEAKLLVIAGKEAGAQAQEENFSLNIPVYFIENGKIVELHASGKKTVLSEGINGKK